MDVSVGRCMKVCVRRGWPTGKADGFQPSTKGFDSPTPLQIQIEAEHVEIRKKISASQKERYKKRSHLGPVAKTVR